MPMTRRTGLGHALAIIGAGSLGGRFLPAAAANSDPLDGTSRAVVAWLKSLDSRQREEARHPFTSNRRTDWHYVPRQRPGVALRDMSEQQRTLLWRVLETVLSDRGLLKTEGALMIEGVLGELTSRPRYRDPKNYALVIFGDPARPSEPWAWRFEGHHLSFTFTHVPGKGIAVTPHFVGANPAEVPKGHHHAGLRLLGDEQEMGFKLLHALDSGLKDQAIIATRSPGDIIAGPGREQSLRTPQGVAFGTLGTDQKAMLLGLVELYTGRLKADLAATAMEKLRQAGTDHLHFAWAGAERPGAPHYYRIHGPTLVIEHDNTQGGANHIHAVWHDPTDGFGEDLLRRHHELDHG